MQAQGYGRSLDGLNFFLADVRDGLGPYLAIYLLTVQHWDEASIGVVMSVAGIAGIVAQMPAGALVDATRFKRGVIVVAALVVTLGSLTLPFLSSFTLVALMQCQCGLRSMCASTCANEISDGGPIGALVTVFSSMTLVGFISSVLQF